MWVARDEDGVVCFYNMKPRKEETQWNSNYTAVVINCSLFPDVKWEDKEPLEVDIVPKNIQSKECEEPKTIDWEQRRYEIAKTMFPTCIRDCSSMGEYRIDNGAEYAIMCAEALIKVLRKGE